MKEKGQERTDFTSVSQEEAPAVQPAPHDDEAELIELNREPESEPEEAQLAANEDAVSVAPAPDFLESIADRDEDNAIEPRPAVSGHDMGSLARAVIRQIKPCYVVPAGGVDIDEIVTIFRLQLHPNGSVRAVNLESQDGVNSSNHDYARQVAEAARRAIVRCAPLDLPGDLYEGGWDDMDIGFRPSSLG